MWWSSSRASRNPVHRELRPMEFDIPRETAAHGELTLSWTQAALL
jgi:hypothetical protein